MPSYCPQAEKSDGCPEKKFRATPLGRIGASIPQNSFEGRSISSEAVTRITDGLVSPGVMGEASQDGTDILRCESQSAH